MLPERDRRIRQAADVHQWGNHIGFILVGTGTSLRVDVFSCGRSGGVVGRGACIICQSWSRFGTPGIGLTAAVACRCARIARPAGVNAVVGIVITLAAYFISDFVIETLVEKAILAA